MVKFLTKEGLTERDAEIRFYKDYKSALKFWNGIPSARQISFSCFGKTDLFYMGQNYSVIIKYYIE